ncbi:MAG: nickel transporter permease [Bacillota bacterium]
MKIVPLIKRLVRSPLSAVGLGIVAVFMVVGLLAPVLTPYDPLAQDLPNRLAPMTREHLFGTDTLGRDILSRFVLGTRISFTIGVVVTGISATAGTLIGLVSGYAGGWVDEAFMRLADIFLAFPSLILAMAIAAVLGPSLTNTMIAIAVVEWPVYSRLVRGQVLSLREKEFVEAARAVGASRHVLLLRHILPNCLAPILVRMTMDMGGVILTAAGLSFIGFGAQPPTPEWGVMISEGRDYIMSHWWISTWPGLAIFTVVMGFNLLGDGLRDLLDPRLKE